MVLSLNNKRDIFIPFPPLSSTLKPKMNPPFPCPPQNPTKHLHCQDEYVREWWISLPQTLGALEKKLDRILLILTKNFAVEIHHLSHLTHF